MSLNRGENELVRGLQQKLDFETQGEDWVTNDQLVKLGGPELYEQIPARLRVSATKNRYELGAHTQDLDALFALAQLAGARPSGAEGLSEFWHVDSGFTAHTDGDHLYIGMDMEPTVGRFERNFHRVIEAYDAALTGAVRGQTVTELAQDNWYSLVLSHLADTTSNAVTSFPELSTDYIQDDHIAIVEETEPITADTLQDFPLIPYDHLTVIPGRVIYKDVIYDINHHGALYFGPQSEAAGHLGIVELTTSRIFTGDQNRHGSIAVRLLVPDNTPINTVADLTAVTEAEISLYDNGEIEEVRPTQVQVSSDSLVVQSGDVTITFETPECGRCETPLWKFTQDTAAMDHITQPSSQWPDTARLYGLSTGGDRATVYHSDFDRSQIFCGNCIVPVTDEYIEQRPFAALSLASDQAQAIIDQLGYLDASVHHDVSDRRDNGWVFVPEIEYSRNGRQITRYLGNIQVADDGEVQASLHGPEIVNFRYQADTSQVN